jgi:hypothetical protein
MFLAAALLPVAGTMTIPSSWLLGRARQVFAYSDIFPQARIVVDTYSRSPA